MKIQRREFVKRSAFGLGGILAGMPLAKAAEAKPDFFDPYEAVALGKSKLKPWSRALMIAGSGHSIRRTFTARILIWSRR